MGAFARKRTSSFSFLYDGKFRCETKERSGWIARTGTKNGTGVHQACDSGFVRPTLCLSFSTSFAGLFFLSPLAISQQNSLTMEKRRNAYIRASRCTYCSVEDVCGPYRSSSAYIVSGAQEIELEINHLQWKWNTQWKTNGNCVPRYI